MKAHLLILIGFLVLAACSKPAQPKHFDELKVAYKKVNTGQPVERQIPIVSAVVDSSTNYRMAFDHSQHQYREHMLCLANYHGESEKANDNKLNDVPPAGDLDPLKVCVNVNDQEGSDVSAALTPGTYEVAQAVGQPYKIASAFIYFGKRDESVIPFQTRAMTGSLRLDAVSDEAIVGEIDLSDSGGSSIAGTFNLKPWIKKYIQLPLK